MSLLPVHSRDFYFASGIGPKRAECSDKRACLYVYRYKLLFWKKMYISNNIILYSLSRHIRDRFMAVDSQYGIFSPLQSVGMIKSAVWLSFAETVNS